MSESRPPWVAWGWGSGFTPEAVFRVSTVHRALVLVSQKPGRIRWLQEKSPLLLESTPLTCSSPLFQLPPHVYTQTFAAYPAGPARKTKKDLCQQPQLPASAPPPPSQELSCPLPSGEGSEGHWIWTQVLKHRLYNGT